MVEPLEFRAAGSDQTARERTSSVLHAYFEAQRARASRRFLWCAVPVITILLVAVQIADGLSTRQSLTAIVGLSAVVVASAAVGERRAARRLHALLRSSTAEVGGARQPSEAFGR